MFPMPGRSHSGPLPPMTEKQRSLQFSLERDVDTLAGRIGERNLYCHDALDETAYFIEDSLVTAGLQAGRQVYEIAGKECSNIETRIPGSERPGDTVLVGAHYDTDAGCPGANDNGTGVAALLALAKAFAGRTSARTLRFVAFANEEPPFFQTGLMGSYVYARRCREEKEKIVAMLSLETIGYYTDEKGSQRYPFPFSLFYPDTGNFIGFIGNLSSRRLVRRVTGSFRRHAAFPSEGAAVPSFVTGVGWSDHWSFWKHGYPGLMVTDTAPYRYPHYHRETDTPDKIDFDGLARVVDGLGKIVEDLAGV